MWPTLLFSICIVFLFLWIFRLVLHYNVAPIPGIETAWAKLPTLAARHSAETTPTSSLIRHPHSRFDFTPISQATQLHDFDLLFFIDQGDVVSDMISFVQRLGTQWRSRYPTDARFPTITHTGMFVRGQTALELALCPEAQWPSNMTLPNPTYSYVLEATLSGPLNDGVYACGDERRVTFGIQFRRFEDVIHARPGLRQVYAGRLINYASTQHMWPQVKHDIARLLTVGYDYNWISWGCHLWRRMLANGNVEQREKTRMASHRPPTAMLCSRMCAEVLTLLRCWPADSLEPEFVVPCDLVFPLSGPFITHCLRPIQLLL